MPRNSRAAVVALALLAAGCRSTVPARLDALFSDLHQRGLFSGAVVAGKGRGVVWAKGFGYANVERHSAFTPDTPSDGASLAKPFTAKVVLMLAREGRIDLDAPAQRLLPELPYREITLRHLLSHSSGLPVLDYDYFDPFLPPPRIRTTEALLSVIAEQKPPLAFPPGTAFEYSSFGYDLAALAAARAAGKPLAEVLDERIFRPLGITSALLRPARLSEFPGIRTLGYRGGAAAAEPALSKAEGAAGEVNDVFDYEAFHGGSNIYISARDLHRWNASFFDNEALEYARIGNAPSGLTLGNWYRNADGTAFSYAGHLQGFHSEVFRNTRTRWSIVYVSNNTIASWLQHAIVRAANAIVHGQDVRALTPPATEEIRKEERDAITGHWSMPDGEMLTIERSDHLTIERNGVRYRMVQVEPRAFYVPGLDFMIGFAKDAGGAPARIHVSTNLDERWGVRRAP